MKKTMLSLSLLLIAASSSAQDSKPTTVPGALWDMGKRILHPKAPAGPDGQSASGPDSGQSGSTHDKNEIVVSGELHVPRDHRLEDTHLKGVFDGHGFDSDQSPEVQYPRVALTVVGSPSKHSVMTMNYARETGCWILSATLWLKPTESEAIEPFVMCLPEDMRQGLPVATARQWAVYPIVSDFKNTGDKRTEGPLPPKKRIPDDIKHQMYYGARNFGSTVSRSTLTSSGDRIQDVTDDATGKVSNGMIDATDNINGNRDIPLGSLDAVMLSSVLWKMGFDHSYMSDSRVWIVKFGDAGLIK